MCPLNDEIIWTEQVYLLNFKAVPSCTAISNQRARTSRGTPISQKLVLNQYSPLEDLAKLKIGE